MCSLRRLLLPALAALFLSLFLNGCGTPSPSQESQWRHDVDASLRELKAATSYHYRINLENWIGVSGQSIYGDQKGEGSFANSDFSLELLQQSPSGDESSSLLSYQGRTYLKDAGEWREAKAEDLPSPLCDPRRFLEIASSYDSVQLEGEEGRSGAGAQRYLLKTGSDRARMAFSTLGWSYFSQLRFEINCRLWVSQSSLPPLSIQLEVTGFDGEESLQRYRLLATLDLYDMGSSAVEVIPPDDLTP